MKNYLNFSTRKISLLILVVLGITTIIGLGGCAPAGWGGHGYEHSGWGAAPMMSGQTVPGGYCGGYHYPGPGHNRGHMWNPPAQPGSRTQ
jgi:hypothetical protein